MPTAWGAQPSHLLPPKRGSLRNKNDSAKLTKLGLPPFLSHPRAPHLRTGRFVGRARSVVAGVRGASPGGPRVETVRRPCTRSFLNQVILLPYTPKGALMNLCVRAQEVMVAGKQRGLLLVT